MLGGSNARCRGCSPVGNSQEQAQDSQRVYVPSQRKGGQAPGTEPQECVPQKAYGRKRNLAPVWQRMPSGEAADGAPQVREAEGSPQRGRSMVASSPAPPSFPRPRRAVLTCQHAGEEHGGEVVVEVEDPAHQEEREVMHHPAQQELPASLQQDLGQPWAPSSTARSADRERAESLV